jgi:hypothetical protein
MFPPTLATSPPRGVGCLRSTRTAAEQYAPRPDLEGVNRDTRSIRRPTPDASCQAFRCQDSVRASEEGDGGLVLQPVDHPNGRLASHRRRRRRHPAHERIPTPLIRASCVLAVQSTSIDRLEAGPWRYQAGSVRIVVGA